MRIGRLKLSVAFVLALACASWIAMPVLRVRASAMPTHAVAHHATGSHGEHGSTPTQQHCGDQDCCCCVSASLPPTPPNALPAPVVDACLPPLDGDGARLSAPDHLLPFSQPPPRLVS